jgi:hypothetical protein
VNYFTSSFLPLVDLSKSNENSLVLKKESAVLASFTPEVLKVEAKPGQTVKLPVTVENRSETPFPHGKATFGLSYHLLSSSGQVLKFDNPRSYFEAPVAPGLSVTSELNIQAPTEPGSYKLKLISCGNRCGGPKRREIQLPQLSCSSWNRDRSSRGGCNRVLILYVVQLTTA